MNRFFFIFICLFLSQEILGKKPLIQSQDTSFVEYQAYLQAHSKYISVINYKKNIHPFKKHKNEIFNLFTKAQKSYLKKNIKKNIKIFKKIIHLKFKDDWTFSERKIIFYSFLRLAELDIKNTNYWIKESLFFDLFQRPSTHFFSPPFQKKWIKQKKQLKLISFKIPKSLKKDFPIVKINGQTLKSNKKIKLVDDILYRFHFLSNTYKPIILIAKPNNIESDIYFKTKLVEGSCEHPQFSTKKIKLALFPQACLGEERIFTFMNYTQNKKDIPHLWDTKWLIAASFLTGFFIYKYSQKSSFIFFNEE